MAFVSLNPADLAQDKPFSTDLALQIKDSLDALNGSFSASASADIPNGSFEVDSDSNGTPDNWTLTTYAGGTVARETTAVAHGAAALKMVHPGGAGNGGGYAVSDYVACSEIDPVIVQMIHWATASGMKNQVIFYWYTAAKVACATPSTTIYSSTANPTSPTLLICGAQPPATARFFKVRIVGGESSVNVAGSAYIDGISLIGAAVSLRPLLNVADFTVAESSRAAGAVTWADVGAAGTLHPAVAGTVPIQVRFTAEVAGAYSDEFSSGVGAVRFRVGSDYSSELAATSMSYVKGVISLNLPSVSTPLSIQMQIRNLSSGNPTVTARKVAEAATSKSVIYWE